MMINALWSGGCHVSVIAVKVIVHSWVRDWWYCGAFSMAWEDPQIHPAGLLVLSWPMVKDGDCWVSVVPKFDSWSKHNSAAQYKDLNMAMKWFKCVMNLHWIFRAVTCGGWGLKTLATFEHTSRKLVVGSAWNEIGAVKLLSLTLTYEGDPTGPVLLISGWVTLV